MSYPLKKALQPVTNPVAGVHIEFANKRTVINAIRRGKIILSVLAELTDLKPEEPPSAFQRRHGGLEATIHYLKGERGEQKA